MLKNKKRTVEQLHGRHGFLFTLPWLIGFVAFFLVPILHSVIFSFSEVEINTGGLGITLTGLENYKYILYESPEYVNNLLDTLSDFIYQIPVIIILSLIIAVVINPKFIGRTAFRSILFIPVIFAGGVVMKMLTADANLADMQNAENLADSVILASGNIDFEGIFLQMGIPTSTANLIFSYVNGIFDILWQCGIQIILFISGLQSIPEQLYEASKVEGASKWEEFWYITIPSLGNVIVLVFVYSVIEFCVSTNNIIFNQAYTVLTAQQGYDLSAAMLWLYFVVTLVISAAFIVVFHRLCLKKWN